MTATLTKLRGLIQTYVNDDLTELTHEDITQLEATIEELINVLLWKIADEYDREKDDAVIAQAQLKLTLLADSVTAFDRDQESTLPVSYFSKFILGQILKVLHHLQTYYPLQFDHEADLPQHFSNSFYTENAGEIEALFKRLMEDGVEQVMIDLLESFFSASRKGGRFQIKYWRQLNFQKNLFQSLKRLADGIDGNATLAVLRLLIATEFNSIQVYGYFVRYLENITLGELSIPDQQQQLIYLAKIFQQVRVDAVTRFDHNAPSLKLSVIESIQAELAYIDEKEKIYMQSFRDVNPEAPTKFYFKVAITLAELMFFFRIALEVKVIMTKFNAYLYEFVSNHIQTERAENISKKSMRNHFNNKPFPDKVVRIVRMWLMRMIDHIDLYYKF